MLERHALIIGASRGLGLHLAGELARRGWAVVATTRGGADDGLRAGPGLTVEHLDMTVPAQVTALRDRLADRRLDLLFVNAAIDRGDVPIHEVPTAVFTEVMITNALSPLRVLEALRDLVRPDGTVAVMSSEQGSVSLNTEGGYELYKASKAALNQLVRGYATRHAADGHTTLLVDPGHNRTRLGGPDAPLDPHDTVPAIADLLEAHTTPTPTPAPHLHFLDRHGTPVPW
ncbi:SDR family oxidoreductase [Saccharothrix violaceirubra]|uniref:NAD(P)-dependent dehydrogenase (Short-subunit alcohol dehydrogenase family) n=1 Tax=Saccharothrix violaceirubra TaxID=413306 RepID=A0A7W7WUY5_9PSEU|nr:SDR family NAD(P)-dependent oxidoreductase [Saccharothrix violaceirubra]MBB4964744.1 NAD(P)-dependent dehydrogenase (short-subunit alcohol dehydrogenase family) [Saccharothrix violaceirubra]